MKGLTMLLFAAATAVCLITLRRFAVRGANDEDYVP
jgi:hypothetical protein